MEVRKKIRPELNLEHYSSAVSFAKTEFAKNTYQELIKTCFEHATQSCKPVSLICIHVLLVQVTKWPAMQKWNRKHLKASFSGCQVTVGDYQMRFKDFLQYLDLNADDMPLYLFDKEFAVKASHLADDFEVRLATRIVCAVLQRIFY